MIEVGGLLVLVGSIMAVMTFFWGLVETLLLETPHNVQHEETMTSIMAVGGVLFVVGLVVLWLS